jgi:3'-phosphoadenosine 5'-phosphosulfate (PAPS) 3'-phosphatase
MAARVPEYMAPYEGQPANDHEVRVAVSSNRPPEPDMMEGIAPSTGVGLGGCGNKCAQLLLDNADAYITSGLSYWDICACEPLVRARGGNVFLGNGDRIKYSAGNTHINGLNATKTIAMKALMDMRRAAKL